MGKSHWLPNLSKMTEGDNLNCRIQYPRRAENLLIHYEKSA